MSAEKSNSSELAIFACLSCVLLASSCLCVMALTPDTHQGLVYGIFLSFSLKCGSGTVTNPNCMFFPLVKLLFRVAASHQTTFSFSLHFFLCTFFVVRKIYLCSF